MGKAIPIFFWKLTFTMVAGPWVCWFERIIAKALSSMNKRRGGDTIYLCCSWVSSVHNRMKSCMGLCQKYASTSHRKGGKQSPVPWLRLIPTIWTYQKKSLDDTLLAVTFRLVVGSVSPCLRLLPPPSSSQLCDRVSGGLLKCLYVQVNSWFPLCFPFTFYVIPSHWAIVVFVFLPSYRWYANW